MTKPAKIFLFNISAQRDFLPALQDALQSIQNIRSVELYDINDIAPTLNNHARSCLSMAADANRNGQVHVTQLVEYMMNTPFIQKNLYMHRKIILLDDDLFDTDLNWCFGVCFGAHYLLLSDYRIKNKTHRRFMLQHELGHLFGAPDANRSDIVQHIGDHCTQPLCSMQQRDTVTTSNSYAKQRKTARAPAYCKTCSRDIANSPFLCYP